MSPILIYIICTYAIALIGIIILVYLITHVDRFKHHLEQLTALKAAFTIALAFAPITLPILIINMIYQEIKERWS